jgi:hypothetical protein
MGYQKEKNFMLTLRIYSDIGPTNVPKSYQENVENNAKLEKLQLT